VARWVTTGSARNAADLRAPPGPGRRDDRRAGARTAAAIRERITRLVQVYRGRCQALPTQASVRDPPTDRGCRAERTAQILRHVARRSSKSHGRPLARDRLQRPPPFRRRPRRNRQLTSERNARHRLRDTANLSGIRQSPPTCERGPAGRRDREQGSSA
jgi:hypothetical protein